MAVPTKTSVHILAEIDIEQKKIGKVEIQHRFVFTRCLIVCNLFPGMREEVSSIFVLVLC
jgi:hypothetical protein